MDLNELFYIVKTHSFPSLTRSHKIERLKIGRPINTISNIENDKINTEVKKKQQYIQRMIQYSRMAIQQ